MRKCILVKILEDQELGTRWNEVNHWNGFSAVYIYHHPSPVRAVQVAFGIQDTGPIRGPEKGGEIIFDKGL